MQNPKLETYKGNFLKIFHLAKKCLFFVSFQVEFFVGVVLTREMVGASYLQDFS